MYCGVQGGVVSICHVYVVRACASTRSIPTAYLLCTSPPTWIVASAASASAATSRVMTAVTAPGPRILGRSAFRDWWAWLVSVFGF